MTVSNLFADTMEIFYKKLLSVRLLSVLRGHSGFFHPRHNGPITSDFEGTMEMNIDANVSEMVGVVLLAKWSLIEGSLNGGRYCILLSYIFTVSITNGTLITTS